MYTLIDMPRAVAGGLKEKRKKKKEKPRVESIRLHHVDGNTMFLFVLTNIVVTLFDDFVSRPQRRTRRAFTNIFSDYYS